MINTSGQDASLLQWNVIGPGGGGTAGGATLPPELPPQAEKQSVNERSATALEASAYMPRSYVSRDAADPCTGLNSDHRGLLGSSPGSQESRLLQRENRLGLF